MSRLNKPNKQDPVYTHEGARAAHSTPEAQLRRAVMSCLLWEKQFYEEGEDIATRIKKLAEQIKPEIVAEIAIEARKVMGLRHVPLLLLEVLTRTGSGRNDGLVKNTISTVITRADEITEFLAIYWNGKKHPLSGQTKKGLELALSKFDEYQLAKYNRDGAVKFRDVLRLVHPVPPTAQSAELYKGILEDTLKTPDTWEVALSGGADKKETFTRLLKEGKLGYMALLRNLRNMEQAGVDRALVSDAIVARKGAKFVLPFRYIAAVRATPSFSIPLNMAFMSALKEMESFSGNTVLLLDVSGSMDARLSQKSDMTRMDAALALGAIFPGQKRLFTFSNNLVEVPSYGGLADIENMRNSQMHGGTALFEAVERVQKDFPFDRLICVTDEQASYSYSRKAFPNALPGKPHYMVNVASYENGVAREDWLRINGFSENIFRYMTAYEQSGE